MKTKTSALGTVLGVLLLAGPTLEAQPAATTLKVAGHAGEAPLVQINGKAYIEVETLARLTQGTLSFKGTQTTLTLPGSEPVAAHASPPKPGFSRAFLQAGIEELGVIRDWRVAIVNAVQRNVPLSEEWTSAQHRQAEKSLALASAAAATEDDHSALQLLSNEFTNMQKLSDLYVAERARSTAMSPETFGNDALQKQILACAQDFVSMTATHAFQDQAACH